MRTAGVVVVIGLVAVLGASLVVSRMGRSRAAQPDVTGIVQLYGDGTLVIETPTAGLREVRVDARTVVRDMSGLARARDRGSGGAPAMLADLRPGRTVALWFRVALDPTRVAAEIDVWGTSR
jgi:hypothetical protein